MSKRILGLVTIKLSAIAVDGGMGISLTAIGDTVPGSLVFEEAEGTKTEMFVEELDTAVESINTPGIESVKWSTNNLDPDVMVKLFGGTKTIGPPLTYEPPDTRGDIELSLEIIDKKTNKFEFVRVKIAAKKAIAFNKTALGQIDIVATVLTPTKAATKPWKITYA